MESPLVTGMIFSVGTSHHGNQAIDAISDNINNG